jgi:uncharacterized protein
VSSTDSSSAEGGGTEDSRSPPGTRTDPPLDGDSALTRLSGLGRDSEMPREDCILMSVGGLTVDPVTKTPIVVLRDADNKLNLPIWIGLLEATAMATELEGIKMARPMTHDLLRSTLTALGATVEAVEVNDLRENTYFALVHLRQGDRTFTIDSRPSDAIALALRTRCPIYVAKAVLEQSSVLQQAEEGEDQNLSNVAPEKWADILDKMGPDDFKYKM